MPTKPALIPLITPGAQVLVRDEDWMVRDVTDTPADGRLVRVTGISELVLDTEAAVSVSLPWRHHAPRRTVSTRTAAASSWWNLTVAFVFVVAAFSLLLVVVALTFRRSGAKSEGPVHRIGFRVLLGRWSRWAF